MQKYIPEMLLRQTEFGGEVTAIGVGFGGIIESSTGLSLVSVQVDGWKDFNLKKWFEETFGLKSIILNDTVAGGYGEYLAGYGKGSRSFFYTNIGSGIGGVFILDGRYYDGIGYGAAYFGHTYIPDWTSNSPGAVIKVENMCSGFGIEKRLRKEGYVPHSSNMMELCSGNREGFDCSILAEAARLGDRFAIDEIDRIAYSYAIGLSNVITLVSADCISIGGGVAKMGDLLLDPIRKYTEELVFISAKGRYRIVGCRHEDNAVLVGSILYASKHE
jgi:glucokinase